MRTLVVRLQEPSFQIRDTLSAFNDTDEEDTTSSLDAVLRSSTKNASLLVRQIDITPCYRRGFLFRWGPAEAADEADSIHFCVRNVFSSSGCLRECECTDS